MAEAAESRQDVYSGTKEVAATHKFDEKKLEHLWLRASRIFSVRWKCASSRADNPTRPISSSRRTETVMRRKPPGKLLPSAHAVDREYKVIAALHPTGFPVPKPYVLCEDESITGTIFYVMDCVEGRIYWDGQLPESLATRIARKSTTR